MAVSKRLRFEILRRDNHACQLCGATAPEAKLTVDHIIPVALGGTDVPENLQAACRDCNYGKSSTPADAAMIATASEAAKRWAAAIRTVAETMDCDIQTLIGRRELFMTEWERWTNGYGDTMPVPGTWEASIDRFYAAGLTPTIIRECIRIAMSKPGLAKDATFNYFCGVAWSKIREMQAGAIQLADAEAVDGA
jgi:hypothetical protein